MDKRHGFGVFQFTNGMKYEGEWEDNLQHGNGVIIDPYGKSSAVSYVNGKLQNKEKEDESMTEFFRTNSNSLKTPTISTSRRSHVSMEASIEVV